MLLFENGALKGGRFSPWPELRIFDKKADADFKVAFPYRARNIT